MSFVQVIEDNKKTPDVLIQKKVLKIVEIIQPTWC